MNVYHEQQRLFHCGIHCLNNLFQKSWVSNTVLDRIAANLHAQDTSQGNAPFINPYRSIIPYLGYYDIAVIAAALQLEDACISEVSASGFAILSYLMCLIDC